MICSDAQTVFITASPKINERLTKQLRGKSPQNRGKSPQNRGEFPQNRGESTQRRWNSSAADGSTGGSDVNKAVPWFAGFPAASLQKTHKRAALCVQGGRRWPIISLTRATAARAEPRLRGKRGEQPAIGSSK